MRSVGLIKEVLKNSNQFLIFDYFLSVTKKYYENKNKKSGGR
jgi:hypothetical protein